MDRFGYDRDRAEVHHRSTYNQAKEFDANGDGFITPDEYARFKAANTQAAGNGQAASNGQASTNTNNSNPYNYPPAALAALEAAGIDPATLNPADFSQGIGSMAGGGQIGAAQHMRKIPPPNSATEFTSRLGEVTS